MLRTWFDQDRSVERVTPRYLIEFTTLIGWFPTQSWRGVGIGERVRGRTADFTGLRARPL